MLLGLDECTVSRNQSSAWNITKSIQDMYLWSSGVYRRTINQAVFCAQQWYQKQMQKKRFLEEKEKTAKQQFLVAKKLVFAVWGHVTRKTLRKDPFLIVDVSFNYIKIISPFNDSKREYRMHLLHLI